MRNCSTCGRKWIGRRRRPGSDGVVRCRSCAHSRRNNKWRKSDKGKASYRSFYDRYGYVHQNKPSRKVRRILALYKTCQLCGTTENLTIDHMHPKIRGGSDSESNLWVLCHSCNSFKRDRLMLPAGGLMI